MVDLLKHVDKNDAGCVSFKELATGLKE